MSPSRRHVHPFLFLHCCTCLGVGFLPFCPPSLPFPVVSWLVHLTLTCFPSSGSTLVAWATVCKCWPSLQHDCFKSSSCSEVFGHMSFSVPSMPSVMLRNSRVTGALVLMWSLHSIVAVPLGCSSEACAQFHPASRHGSVAFCSWFVVCRMLFLCVYVASNFDTNMPHQPICGFCDCGDNAGPSEFSIRSTIAAAFAGMPCFCIGRSALRCRPFCSRVPSSQASAARTTWARPCAAEGACVPRGLDCFRH